MKKYFFSMLMLLVISSLNGQKLIELSFDDIQSSIKKTPLIDSEKAATQFGIIDLPMPNGEIIEFVVKHSPLVLSNSPLYDGPAGRTYSLHSPSKAGYNGSLVLYANGIHATLITPDGLLFVERPNIIGENTSHKYTYFKDTAGFPHSAHDAVKTHLAIDRSQKHTHQGETEEHVHAMPTFKANNNFFSVGSGNMRKTIDLFVLSEKSFLDAYSGNTTNATNRVIEVVNGVKAVWEQDFNLTINYMGVYFNPTQVQANLAGATTIWDATSDGDVTGGTKAQVDLAHFMAGNGGGGAGGLFVACGSSKHQGYSGIPNPADASFIPLVAHEMAHQMGADHTWTGSDASCTNSQWGKNSGVEPGAGVTLAGYAGICGTDNIPGAGKGNYHHIESLREIVTYAQTGMGKVISNTTITGANEIPAYDQNYGLPTCITSTTFNNNVPSANANPDNITNFNIPARTAFELNGSATDADSDPLTYQWDQLDFALVQQPLDGYATRTDGPLFRSFGPKSGTKREFPQLANILSGTQQKGEKLAEVNRRMRFALVVRDGKGGVGVDTVSFNVIDNGSSFAITESIDVSNPSTVTINWNVAGTTNAPISCGNIDILYSTDGGQTFPHTLSSGTANDGSEVVNLASFGSTGTGRIKIKCSNNIFFDINNANLSTVPAGCIAQSSEVIDPQTVTGASGDASFDFDETKKIFNPQIITSKTVTVSSTQGATVTDNGGSCGASNFGEYHTAFEFSVSQTGTYTITGPSAIGILQTSNYTYNDQSPCAGTFIGANFTQAGQGQALTPTLTANVTYVAVVSNQNQGAATMISFSGSGNVITSDAQTAGTSYTYIAVNNANSTIAKVDNMADFKSLTSGSYKVYGVSYLSSISTASWVGQTESAALSTSTCAIKSTNTHNMTVTGGGSPCNTSNTKNVLPGDITANAIFHDGKIVSGGLGGNKVTINANNVTFKGVNSVDLNPEFEVLAPNVFTAEIGPCSTP